MYRPYDRPVAIVVMRSTMLPPVLRLVGALLLATLAACSSSPSKNESTVPAEQAAVPAAPPPIPPEATQEFEKALTLMSGGDLDVAAQQLRQMADQYPDYSGPLINLGIVYLKQNKLADAEKTLQASTQRGEPNPVAYNQLGIVYRKLGRFKDADAAYTQALHIDPNYALAHLNLGVLCDMYLGEPQRALTELERYLALTPNPDARVATWVKELQIRTGTKPPAETAPAPTTPANTTPAAAPANTPTSAPNPADAPPASQAADHVSGLINYRRGAA